MHKTLMTPEEPFVCAKDWQYVADLNENVNQLIKVLPKGTRNLNTFVSDIEKTAELSGRTWKSTLKVSHNGHRMRPEVFA